MSSNPIRVCDGMRRTRLSAIVIALTSLLCSTVFAQSDNFDDMFFDDMPPISGDFLNDEPPLSDAAAYVTVVTARDIEHFGYRTLAEIISTQAGFYVSDDGLRPSLGVRGFSSPGELNSRILLMLNGQRLNDGGFDGWFAGENGPIDVLNIERIEIIRGPGTSAFGANAWAGVINIKTKSGRQRDGVDAYLQLDDRDRQVASLAFGQRYANGLDIDLSARVLRAGAESAVQLPEISPSHADALRPTLDIRDGESAFLQAAFGNWFAQYGITDYEKSSPIDAFGSGFSNGVGVVRDLQRFGMLQWHHVSAAGTETHVRLHQEATELGLTSLSASTTPTATNGQQQFTYIDSSSTTIEADVSRTLGIHQVSGGVFVSRQSPLFSFTSRNGILLASNRSRSTFRSVFAQDEVRLSENISAIVGLRVDKRGETGAVISPRLAWVQHIPGHFDLKILLGEASRRPNWLEDSDGFTQKAELSDIDDEDIHTFEVQFAALPGRPYWHVSLYDYRIDEQIVPTFSQDGVGLQYINSSAKTRSRGIELERRWRLPAANLAFNLTYTRSEDETTGLRSPFSPRVMGNLRVSNVSLGKRLTMSGELRYRGDQLTARRETSPSTFQVFASMRWQPWADRNFAVILRARNLGDRTALDPVSGFYPVDQLQQPGRTLALELDWRSQ
ncbi:MAG: TonB-dependent receptor [Pseudomonadota bacterium]